MVALTGRQQKDTFGDLLQVSNANVGIDATSRPIEDGKGTVGPFEVSTTQTKYTQKMLLNGQDLFLDTDADSKFITSVDDVLTLQLNGASLFGFDGSAASPVNGLRFDASAATNPTTVNASGTDTNIDISLVPKGTGVVDIGGAGLTFTGGQTIADYEVTPFTPKLGASVTDGVHTYNTQAGVFIRLGNLLWFTLTIDVSALDVGISGNLLLRDLPFAGVDFDTALPIRADDITMPVSGEYFLVRASGTDLNLIAVRTGTSIVTITDADISGTTPLFVATGVYRIS